MQSTFLPLFETRPLLPPDLLALLEPSDDEPDVAEELSSVSAPVQKAPSCESGDDAV